LIGSTQLSECASLDEELVPHGQVLVLHVLDPLEELECAERVAASLF
jgi:hypothetical protein